MENTTACFETKFHAYNLDSSRVLAKRYVYPPLGTPLPDSDRMDLGEKELVALSLALKSPCLSTLNTGRFSLYEISFRGESGVEAVSFSFIDTRDREYLSPAEVLVQVSEFDVDPLARAAKRLEACIFPSGVDYNPSWMFGLLFAREMLIGVKAYMRFDLERALGPEGRREVITRIVSEHGAQEKLGNDLLAHAHWLEDCGFFLRFLGIDQRDNGSLRYKFYFRSDGSENPDTVRRRLVEAAGDPAARAAVEEIFRRHHSGMWGIGVSVGTLNRIEGHQLYFYPQSR